MYVVVIGRVAWFRKSSDTLRAEIRAEVYPKYVHSEEKFSALVPALLTAAAVRIKNDRLAVGMKFAGENGRVAARNREREES